MLKTKKRSEFDIDNELKKLAYEPEILSCKDVWIPNQAKEKQMSDEKDTTTRHILDNDSIARGL